MKKIKNIVVLILKWISTIGAGILFFFSLWQLQDLNFNGNIGYTIGRLLGPVLLGWLFWATLPLDEREKKE